MFFLPGWSLQPLISFLGAALQLIWGLFTMPFRFANVTFHLVHARCILALMSCKQHSALFAFKSPRCGDTTLDVSGLFSDAVCLFCLTEFWLSLYKAQSSSENQAPIKKSLNMERTTRALKSALHILDVCFTACAEHESEATRIFPHWSCTA